MSLATPLPHRLWFAVLKVTWSEKLAPIAAIGGMQASAISALSRDSARPLRTRWERWRARAVRRADGMRDVLLERLARTGRAALADPPGGRVTA